MLTEYSNILLHLQAPPHSGSIYYNYKKFHSINLTGVSDARCRFILVDVGAESRRSDAVFNNSQIKSKLDNKNLQISEPSAVGENDEIPYVLLGDEAYPLTTYLMRPYPKSLQLDLKKKVYNYRHSRARRIIESAFGILVARWRIFRRPINAYVRKAEKMILATVCLHNFIINNELKKSLTERRYLHYNEHDQQQVSFGIRNISS